VYGTVAGCCEHCNELLGYHLDQGCLTCDPPGCIIRPVAVFLNFVYAIEITQSFGRLAVPLNMTLNVRPANQATITLVTLGHKNGWTSLI
jgi:hypothetical protein